MILDVNEHCVNKLIFLNNRRKIERDLFAVMKDIAKIEMEYVWKIAIVPSKNYVESVKKISKQLNTERIASETALACVIVGKYNEEIKQAMVINEEIFKGLILFLYDKKVKEDRNKDELAMLGVQIFFHECGHLKEGIKSLKLGRNIILNKVQYNLENAKELSQYIDEQSFGMWGEYYAESFKYKMLNNIINVPLETNGLEQKILEYVNILESCYNKKSMLIKEQYETAYVLLYEYVHYISYFHIVKDKNVKLKNLKKINNKKLINRLNRIGRLLKKTYLKYENENIKLDQLEKICKNSYLSIINIKNDNVIRKIKYWVGYFIN